MPCWPAPRAPPPHPAACRLPRSGCGLRPPARRPARSGRGSRYRRNCGRRGQAARANRSAGFGPRPVATTLRRTGP
ncbi:hypothetical protein G6F61_014781 [Rhizopus arrhizus]|nr:hypothetical protein G6F31_017100 [Rhizopus arrhizus]KAG1346052.1 hypothetical protein G6F61_014781 [Rhizopus arrhizus]